MWAEIYLMTIKMVVIFFHLVSFWDSLIRPPTLHILHENKMSFSIIFLKTCRISIVVCERNESNLTISSV